MDTTPHAEPMILPHLDRQRILRFYELAGGNEVKSGNLGSPESSAALAANCFGYFIDRPNEFTGMPGLEMDKVTSVEPEQCLRFPWSSGRHPWLDAVVLGDGIFLAVEAKRYEPFRSQKVASFAETYSSHDWGSEMSGFTGMLKLLKSDPKHFRHLDSAQLVKHAFGLATQSRKPEHGKRAPVLYYLYAEPDAWPDGRKINDKDRKTHRSEISEFAAAVGGDRIRFVSGTWHAMIKMLSVSPVLAVRSHAAALAQAFVPI